MTESDSTPLVSVIVVNHNRADLLRECLDSLLAQTYPCVEILVVDNASTDASRELVRGYPDSRIRLIELESNLGFGVPNNIGIKNARGSLIAILNNDAVADPAWLQRLVDCLVSYPDVGMCASKILVFGTSVIDKAGHLIYPDGQNRGRGRSSVPLPRFWPSGYMRCPALSTIRVPQTRIFEAHMPTSGWPARQSTSRSSQAGSATASLLRSAISVPRAF